MIARLTYQLTFIVFATVLACLIQTTSANTLTEQVVVADQFLSEIQRQAQDGDTNAQRKLGLIYLTGKHLEKNPEKALYWLEKAAAKNDIEALKSLGKIYAEGLSVEINLKKSVEYFELAASQGDAIAAAFFGQAYEKGLGVEVDYSTAAQWYQDAAEKGDAKISRKV